VLEGIGAGVDAGSPEPRRLGPGRPGCPAGPRYPDWRPCMPGPMCSICTRGMPAMAAASVGFAAEAAAAAAVGVLALSPTVPGSASAVGRPGLPCGFLGVCNAEAPDQVRNAAVQNC